MNKFLIIPFTVLAIRLTADYVVEKIQRFYLFMCEDTHVVAGVVKAIDRNEDLQGALSFQYRVTYQVSGKNYTITELLSPDSVAHCKVNDSVKLFYPKSHPQYATLKEGGFRYAELGLALLIIIILTVMTFNSFQIILKVLKRKDVR